MTREDAYELAKLAASQGILSSANIDELAAFLEQHCERVTR
jgi:hypothetical protein